MKYSLFYSFFLPFLDLHENERFRSTCARVVSYVSISSVLIVRISHSRRTTSRVSRIYRHVPPERTIAKAEDD